MESSKYGLSERDMRTLVSVFEQFPEVRQVCLFGSRAKGVYHSGSDIDLAVMNEGVSYKTFCTLKSKFDETSLPYRVDLVNFSTLTYAALREHIERVGVAIIQ